MFNLSFLCGSFPTILKTSNVTPIYKKDSKLKCSNYRPISLLSNIDKILERIVYNRLYKLFENNKLVYNLQFGFRQKHSTSHALIHLTEKIREQFDSGKYGCGIFADFQKAFDTVHHAILTQNLNYYGVRGKANNWFSSDLKNRTQFVTINGFNSELKQIKCGVPEGSILGPLLLLIYINDLHYSIKFCKVHHFADDRNRINFNSSIKVINKQVNKDLKTLSNWLKANKICLNVSKTEAVLFKSAKKHFDSGLKLKLNGKRLYPTNSVKYLGVKLDEHLTGKPHTDGISAKLTKANAMLSKIRHFVDQKTLKAIYHAIFESHLYYSSLVWAQNFNSTKRLFILQKKH